jgi:hypothetical protein
MVCDFLFGLSDLTLQSGLNVLLRHCTPDAAHDSYARENKDLCFPGTRDQQIADLTAWITSADGERRHRLFWMYGPAGAGKSTIAQSCAKEAEAHGVLGASFFFSRDNGVIDPRRFFTTIARQLSTQIDEHRTILEAKVRHNPTLPTKSLETQLQELIVTPFLKLEKRSAPLQSRAIVVDGLDECDGDASQSKIVELVARSIETYGSKVPLLWLFFSRPEQHIDHAFSDERTSHLPWQVELPVSRDIDGEIRIYLRGSLRLHGVALWPSDDDLETLVDMVAGLFIYASTIVKYIMDPNAFSPERRLKDVLSLRSLLPANPRSNPTAGLDEFYWMIMNRIPYDVLPIVQQILLVNIQSRYINHRTPIRILANTLGLTLPELENALSRLRSVLTLRCPKQESHFLFEPNLPGSSSIFFFHASFMEFLLDPTRSKNFCLDKEIHWQILAMKGLHLMKDMYSMNGTPLGRWLSDRCVIMLVTDLAFR